MLRFIIVSLLFVFSSCASSARDWKIHDVSDEKKDWRICSEKYDGPEKNFKGFCYISQECYKTVFRNRKCRPLPLFCAWGDTDCILKYGLDKKKLKK